MRRISYFIIMLVFCALLSYGCNPKQTALSEKGGIWAVYDRECRKCHKVNGKGCFIGRFIFKTLILQIPNGRITPQIQD